MVVADAAHRDKGVVHLWAQLARLLEKKEHSVKDVEGGLWCFVEKEVEQAGIIVDSSHDCAHQLAKHFCLCFGQQRGWGEQLLLCLGRARARRRLCRRLSG